MRHFIRTLLAVAVLGWVISWAPVLDALAEAPEGEAGIWEVQPPKEGPDQRAGISVRLTSELKPVASPEPTPAPEPEIPIYDVPLAEDLQRFTYQQCREAGVDYELVLALIGAESGYRADVVANGNYGLMQINQCNHQWLREELGITDFLDPRQNIRAGVCLLSGLAQEYEEPGRVLMAYNMGEAGARRLWEAGTESSAYSRTVMDRRNALEIKG